MRFYILKNKYTKNEKSDILIIRKLSIAKEMLEIIPNKITDTMGIIVDVNHLHKGQLKYL